LLYFFISSVLEDVQNKQMVVREMNELGICYTEIVKAKDLGCGARFGYIRQRKHMMLCEIE